MKNEREFEAVKKILERKCTSYGLDGFASIAFGEALTKLSEKEERLGDELPTPAKKSFLFVVAKNIIENERKRTKNKEYLGDGNNLKKFSSLAVSSEEDRIFATSDVRDAVEKLSKQQKEAVKLVHFDGMSYNDAAQIMEISLNTVKYHLKEALKNLAKILRE